MKKIVAIILTVAVIAMCAVACGNPTPETSPAQEASSSSQETAEGSEVTASDITVGIVIYSSEIPFASDLGAAAVKACQEKGYNYLYLDGQGDMATQQLGVEDWIATDSIDALIIESVDSEGAGALMDACAEAGIVVVAADTKPNSDVPIAVVQSDNYQMGEQSAQAALDYLKAKYGEEKVIQAMGTAPSSFIETAQTIIYYEEESSAIHSALVNFFEVITGVIVNGELAQDIGETMDEMTDMGSL